MDHSILIESFSEFKEFKSIDRATMMSILEDVFKNMLRKKYGSADNLDVIINIDKGDLEVWRNRTIVEDGTVEDENLQIPYSEAIKIEPDFEIGEEVTEAIKLEAFGRRAVLAARQNLQARIMELEKDAIYKNTKTALAKLLPVKFTRFGKKKHWFLMMKEMNCCYRNQNRFLPIFSAKVIL